MNEIPEPIDPNAETKTERIKRLFSRAGDHVQKAVTDPNGGRLEWDGQVKLPPNAPITLVDVEKFVSDQASGKFDREVQNLNKGKLPPPPKLENPQ